MIIFPSPMEATASPSFVIDAQGKREAEGFRGFGGPEARPQAGSRESVWALNKLNIVAGHPGEGAESAGAVLALPGAGRGSAGGRAGHHKPGAALHARRNPGTAGEPRGPSSRPQSTQVSPGSREPFSPANCRNGVHLRAGNVPGFIPQLQAQTSGLMVAQTVKSLPSVRETRVRSLGWEDPLEKEMATHSSILAWEIPWMEDPGGLQSMVGAKSRTRLSDFTFPFLS